jgi:diacylglycerol kinase family enzyme
MYYYIVEPLTTQAEKRKIEEIKAILSQLGIAGEFAVASPARTVEEHMQLAIKKGFSTVVGIGSDALANKVASTLLRYRHDQAAMGVIPFSPQQQLWQMIGGTNLREICESLRTRLIISIDAVRLTERDFFITEASIHQEQPVRFHLAYNHLHLAGQFTDLTITNTGFVQLWDSTYNPPPQAGLPFLKKLFGTSQTAENRSLTQFQSKTWQFETEKPCDVLVNGEPATQTPLLVELLPKALKLIVNRARMTPDKTINEEP